MRLLSAILIATVFLPQLAACDRPQPRDPWLLQAFAFHKSVGPYPDGPDWDRIVSAAKEDPDHIAVLIAAVASESESRRDRLADLLTNLIELDIEAEQVPPVEYLPVAEELWKRGPPTARQSAVFIYRYYPLDVTGSVLIRIARDPSEDMRTRLLAISSIRRSWERWPHADSKETIVAALKNEVDDSSDLDIVLLGLTALAAMGELTKDALEARLRSLDDPDPVSGRDKERVEAIRRLLP